jgi:hypothetical protein
VTPAQIFGQFGTRLSAIRLSRRERLLLLALLAVLSLAWAVTSFEGAQAARGLAIQARQELLLEEGREARMADPKFRQAVALEAEKARAWSLNEPTVYIAQMRAQSQLEDFAVAAGIPNYDIVVERPDPPEGGIQRLSFAVEGDFDRAAFLNLLGLLEASQPNYVPVTAEVSTTSDTPRFSLVLAAAYIQPEGRP